MSHFTKSQIEEIRQRLATKAVRDSDLENTSSFDGDDFVAIVQDGENRKLDVNTFRNELQNGPRGESAYEAAVRHGYTGTEEEWVNQILDLALAGRVATLEEAVGGATGIEHNISDLLTRVSALETSDFEGEVTDDTDYGEVEI